MVISLNALKKLEGIKVETQVVLEKLHKKLSDIYSTLLKSQHTKRVERIRLYQLQQRQILREADRIWDKLDDKIFALQDQNQEIKAGLYLGK